MFYGARRRAKATGLPFNLSESDIVIPTTCPVLGIPLFSSSKNKPEDNSPSLDRLIPANGYVKGNIMVISFRANRIKYNATVTELRKIARWMVHCGRPTN